MDIFVCSVCNAKCYDRFIHKSLLDIEHGVFFVVKHNFFEPPTYFMWCHEIGGSVAQWLEHLP